MALPLAVERVDEALGLRAKRTEEEKLAERVEQALTVPTPEQNDIALAKLQAELGGLGV